MNPLQLPKGTLTLTKISDYRYSLHHHQIICSWAKEHGEVSLILDDDLNLEKLKIYNPILLIAFYLANEVLYKKENKRDDLLKRI